MNTIDFNERHIRRELERRGLRLSKMPARSWLRDHYEPGYQVLDGNTVIFGCWSRLWEATLDEVEAWLRGRLMTADQRQRTEDATPGKPQVARPAGAAKWGWDQSEYDQALASFKRWNAEDEADLR